MKNFKRIIQTILISTPILLSGCSDFSEEDLNKPIQEHLAKYGVTEKFTLIETDDNWFEGIDHQTTIKINKPYVAYPFLMVERDTLKILEEESDNIFLEEFKGAYIEQHTEVFKLIKHIIKKYGLLKHPEGTPTSVFPYDNIELNIIGTQVLLDDFKKTHKIDTKALLPTLRPSDPRRVNYNSRYVGVVNFLFEFDMNKNKHPIPKATDLLEDFQKSGVLTQGIYNIDLLVDDSNPDNMVGWDYNNVVLIEVDENGKYTIIANPTYDDLDKAYFYGDYAAKKNKE